MASYELFKSKQKKRSINVYIRKTPSFFQNKDSYYKDIFKEICMDWGLSFSIKIFDDMKAIEEYEKVGNQDHELIKKHFIVMFVGPFIGSGLKYAQISHYPCAIVHDPVYGKKVRMERLTIRELFEANNKSYEHEIFKGYFEIEYAKLIPVQFKYNYELSAFKTDDIEFSKAIEEYFSIQKLNIVKEFSGNVLISLAKEIDIADEFLKIQISEISEIEAFNKKTGEINGVKLRGYYAISNIPSELIADSLFSNWISEYSENLLQIIYNKQIQYKGKCEFIKLKIMLGRGKDIILYNKLGI